MNKVVTVKTLTGPEVEALRIYGQSVHECSKVVSPTHRPPLTQATISSSHFC
jgi:hypothetical protein